MADDQAVKLLEEIRDLQKEFLANQKVALQNQQEAIAIQKGVVQRNKILYVALAGLFVFLGLSYIIPLLSWMVGITFRR
jgi:hypothetical protein